MILHGWERPLSHCPAPAEDTHPNFRNCNQTIKFIKSENCILFPIPELSPCVDCRKNFTFARMNYMLT